MQLQQKWDTGKFCVCVEESLLNIFFNYLTRTETDCTVWMWNKDTHSTRLVALWYTVWNSLPLSPRKEHSVSLLLKRNLRPICLQFICAEVQKCVSCWMYHSGGLCVCVCVSLSLSLFPPPPPHPLCLSLCLSFSLSLSPTVFPSVFCLSVCLSLSLPLCL